MLLSVSKPHNVHILLKGIIVLVARCYMFTKPSKQSFRTIAGIFFLIVVVVLILIRFLGYLLVLTKSAKKFHVVIAELRV